MATFDFEQVICDPKDGGQRVEVAVLVSRSDVESVLGEFYEAMAKVKHLDIRDMQEVRQALEALIGEEVLKDARRDYLLNRFTTAVLYQLEYDTVLTPGVHADKDPESGEDFAFVANLVLRPELSLSSTEPVRVVKPQIEIESKDIDEQISYAAQQFAEFVRSDRSVLHEGDFALVDIDMVKNGRVDKGLSGSRRLIEVKHGLLPIDLIEGMEGMESGEIRKIEFTLPKDSLSVLGCLAGQRDGIGDYLGEMNSGSQDFTVETAFAEDTQTGSQQRSKASVYPGREPYPQESSAEGACPGQKASQEGDRYCANVRLWEVQEKAIPIIDDEWIAANLPQFKDLEHFRAYIRSDFELQRGKVEQQDLVYQVRSALEKRLVGSIPDDMYQEAKDSLMISVMEKINRQGMTLDEYCESHDIANDVFNMNIFMQAAEYLRQNLALDVLAQEKGFFETEDEIREAKAALPSGIADLTDEEFAERGFRKTFAERIRREKAMKWLMDTVEFSDVQ